MNGPMEPAVMATCEPCMELQGNGDVQLATRSFTEGRTEQPAVDQLDAATIRTINQERVKAQ